jgi:acyl-CoA dehydrogenase
MNEELEAIASTAAQICASIWTSKRIPAVSGGWAAEVWEALVKAQFTLLPLPEEHGGAGAGMREAAVVLRELGRFGVPVPLVETALLASWLLVSARLPVPSGPLTAAAPTNVSARPVKGGYVLSGTLTRVPYGHLAERVVLLAESSRALVLSINAADYRWTKGRNLAGEPRDCLSLNDVFVHDTDAAEVDGDVNGEAFRIRGALGTSLLMAGAMEAAVAASVAYASERVQFGRPIIRFQAVQHHLAEMAAESTATNAAVMSAADAVRKDGSPNRLMVAAAKVQAGRSGSVVSRLAHQIHGAVGFTQEHSLHHCTTRLWSWRDEFGNERYWTRVIGEEALDATGLWALVTDATKEVGA